MKNILLTSPRDCYLILTAKCNLRCRHCYGAYGCDVPREELTGEEWCTVIDDLEKNNVFFVNISGGEPTLHPNFSQVIEYIKSKDMLYILTTNGVCSANAIETIINTKEYCLGIKISLDGPDSQSHAFLRRDLLGNENKSLFKITLSTIKRLVKNNLPLTIATCLHPKNIDKVDEMMELIIKLKPKSWYISTISLSGNAVENQEIFVSESKHKPSYWENIKEVCKKNDIEVVFVDMPTIIKSKDNPDIYFNCPAARTFCEIYSDGTVSPCPLARVHMNNKYFNFKNIKENSLQEIWKSKEFSLFRDLQHKGCHGCKARKQCDRCLPQSIQWFNDPMIPPPYCIQNAKTLQLSNKEKLENLLKDKMKEHNRSNYL